MPLRSVYWNTDRRIRANAVLLLLAEEQGVTVADLRSYSKESSEREARRIAAWVIREVSGASLARVGELLGGRSHVTIRGLVNTVADLREEYAELRTLLDALVERSTLLWDEPSTPVTPVRAFPSAEESDHV